MKGHLGKLHWLCLLIVALFLTEYLEPSAVGVRVDFDPPVKQEKADPKGPQSSEGGATASPHAMLSSGPSSLETLMFVRSFRPDPFLPPPQGVSSPIYRPPLAAR